MKAQTKQKVYCVESVQNGAVEVADTFRGAMVYARKHGYYNVGVRFVNSGYYFPLASLPRGGKNTKWIKTQYGMDRSYIE